MDYGTSISNVNFKCQTSNINFQISKFKSQVGDNPSCATQQLIQKQVVPFNMSNFKSEVLNTKFQMPVVSQTNH